jgi:copper chaperone CopZ
VQPKNAWFDGRRLWLFLGVLVLLSGFCVVPARAAQVADPTQASPLPVTTSTDNEGECTASTATASTPSLQATVQRLLQSASATVPSYYLLWSPGATKKLFVSSLWLAVFHVYRDTVTLYFSSSILGNSWITNVCLPLLSSACCAIQLLLNVMGVGCGGFNTYLGPIRPYFLSLLGYLSLVVYPPTITVTGCVMLVMRGILALLPEAVHLWNAYWTTPKTSNPWLSESRLQTHGIQATVELIVPTMGCVACVNKINSSLQQASPRHFLTGNSWLVPEKGGQASVTLWAKDEKELQQLIATAQDTIHAAGFPDTTIASISKKQQPRMITGDSSISVDDERFDRVSIEALEKNISPVPIQIDFLVPSMSCTGCIAEVNTVAKQASNMVQSVSSSLFPNYEGGHASIVAAVSSQRELDVVIEQVNKSLEANGFDGNALQSTKLVVEAIAAEVTWTVPTMSCDHCIRTIDAAVRKLVPLKHIVTVISRLGEEGGSTTVTLRHVSSLQELDSIVALLEGAFRDGGYEEGLLKSSLSWQLELPDKGIGDTRSLSYSMSSG